MSYTPELLIDGYISQSFSPNSAEEYLHHLLKTNQSGMNQSCQTLLKPDGSGVLFAVRTIPENLSTTPFTQDRDGRPLWLLDYSIVRTGTVIPQALWSPDNATDHRNHVAEAILQMPIFFMQKNGILGLSLNDAINGRCQTLRDARMLAQLGGKTTTHIRIAWPGYNVFKRQVQIRDESPAKNPITIGKFAHHIGRSIEAFLRNLTPNQTRRAEFDRWTIGQGGINPIDIKIIGIIHVSAGSWMPILQLYDVWIF
ncbi:hypothetical protein DFH94DRAFT_496786 [Russula ochroleuca]|jgi:hypothetical protein|uniref:Uncharacterized protein n=1 Tax=Russula ochroleuca TaxID=152965 RepID=A0A9P5MVL7_9AGAM|nr:hypothetical protein DFH94DRAFT_496786 [Russula ochroleuca]